LDVPCETKAIVGVSAARPEDVPTTLATSAATAATSTDTRSHRVREFRNMERSSLSRSGSSIQKLESRDCDEHNDALDDELREWIE
jgi:hypothetical protein